MPDRAAELFLGAVRSGCVAPQQASELLGQVAEQAPGNVAALWLHARLADASRDRALDADLFKALARAPSPTRVALLLAANGLYRVGDELRFWAFQQDPSLAEPVLSSTSSAAFCFEAWSRLSQLQPRPLVARELAVCAVNGLFVEELPMLAAETYRSFPENLRTEILAGTLRPRSSEAGDVRELLAAEFLVEGDRDAALALFRAALASPLPGVEGSDTRNALDASLRRRTLGALLLGEKTDAFEVAVDTAGCNWCGLSPWPSLYHKLVGPRLGRLIRATDLSQPPQVSANLPVARARIAEAWQAEHRRLDQAGLLAPPRPTGSAPRPEHFREHRLPEGLPSPGPDLRERFDRCGRKPGSLPENFLAQRVDQVGDRLSVVASVNVWGPLDGGYWFLESADAGKTWSEPLYLGLRENYPYVVAPTSGLPLREGELLRIEVQVREQSVDESCSPLLGPRYLREEKGLFIEANLADLRRDSDGDGLTDLVEERLMLDPHRADTDGDGIPDGLDRMPNVPFTSGPPAPEGKAVTAFLKELVDQHEEFLGRVPKIVGEGLGERGQRLDKVPSAAEPIMVVVGDARAFAGLAVAGRVVVLSPDQYRAARARFGAFCPLYVDVVFDDAGRRFFLAFSADNISGAYLGTRGWLGGWSLKWLWGSIS
ncbi:MAG: hypothetical protein QM765_07775 [Myxococcales bacterium]